MSDLLTQNPLVTIYIPTYNRIELLKRAVDSVRNQSYTNLEIIIVDDCSTDGTQEYLKELVQLDSRIRYFFKEKNSGACVSRNIAIENATGEFITGLDDDDYFLQERIKQFIDQKNELNKYHFLYSLYLHKTKDGIHENRSEKLKPNVISSKDLLSLNYVNNQIFTKTERLRTVGFNEDMPAWQDLYTWYTLLEKSNKKAKCIKVASYVMDVSHEFSRISVQKLNKIKVAYDIFCREQNLDLKFRKILECQLINYGFKQEKFHVLLLSLINSINIYSLIVFKTRLIGRS